jgi:cystathionine beta-lyase/cystathionine gamma-synthase
VIDQEIVIRGAHQAGARVIIDNTFVTPFLSRPLESGADIVVHSATKFLNGHGDVLGGVVSGSSELMGKVRALRKLIGGTMGPFDAWLALRGTRTLALRMQQACRSALDIANWLQEQQVVSRVYYPGLPSDPSYSAASRIFRASYYGSMIAFEIASSDRRGTFAFVKRLQLIRPVTSLGDVTSLILHPASSSHRALTPEQREAQNITEGTLRLSVGIEAPEDLISDLAQALAGNHY